jgi:exosortase A
MSIPMTIAVQPKPTSRAALRMCGLAGILVLVVLAYWPSFVSMAQMWTLSSYRHGTIIPFISLLLLWQQRTALVDAPWKPSLLGAAILAATVWVWLVARATFVQAAEHVAVVAMLNAAVWAIAGSRVYASAAFPLGYLAAALPIGTSIVPALMEVTADVSVAALQFTGVPVLRQGMLMTLPGGVFEVADVCSGFRYLNTGIALGVLVAYVTFLSLARRAMFVAVVAVAFVITNGIRAYIVMAVASATNMRWLAGDDHIVFGWILFLIVMVGLYFLAERYSDRGGAKRDAN